jgi:hypothetical protein
MAFDQRRERVLQPRAADQPLGQRRRPDLGSDDRRL